MEIFFRTILGKTTAYGIAGLLFFTTPTFLKKNDTIVINGNLNGIITKKVKRILNTGTLITIIFHFSIFVKDNDKEELLQKKVKHKMKYYPLEGKYVGQKNNQKIFTKSIKKLEKYMGIYQVQFHYNKSIKNKIFDFYVEAEIKYTSSLKIKIPSEAIWEYHIPNKKIKNILIKESRE